MRFSIIVATFNSAATIHKCLDSIFNQKYKSFEVIVVDGASADATVSIARDFDSAAMKFIVEKDRGIYDAWNKALKVAKGEYFLFLGSDDFYFDDLVLNRLDNAITTFPDSLFWYAQTYKMSSVEGIGYSIGGKWLDVQSFTFNHVHASLANPIMSTAYRSGLVRKFGFDLNYRITADYDLILKMLKEKGYATPHYMGEINLVSMGYGGVSTGMRTAAKCLSETMSVRSNHGLSNLNFTILSRSLKIYFYQFVHLFLGENKANFLLRLWHKIR